MNQQADFSEMAKTVIDSTLYMVLGTADESGQPWASPVYFVPSKYKEFYWVSSPETRHSRNIAQCSQTSIVIFDSQVPVGKAEAVYMSASAEELTGSDLERSTPAWCLSLISRRGVGTLGARSVRFTGSQDAGEFISMTIFSMRH